MTTALQHLALAIVRLHESGIDCGFSLADGVCETWYLTTAGTRQMSRVPLGSTITEHCLRARFAQLDDLWREQVIKNAFRDLTRIELRADVRFDPIHPTPPETTIRYIRV